MKRKMYLMVIAVVLLAALSIPAAFAAQDNISTAAPDSEKQINLTEDQKKELKQISDQMYELKKQMVKKYVEFGIITKEQGDKKLKKLEEKQKFIEQNGYTPRYGKGFGKDNNDKKSKTDVKEPNPEN